jgi:hypothetical protein
MALAFSTTPDTWSSSQTHRGYRLFTIVFIALSIVGVPLGLVSAKLTARPAGPWSTLACTRAAGTCTVTSFDDSRQELPLVGLSTVFAALPASGSDAGDGIKLMLQPASGDPYFLCSTATNADLAQIHAASDRIRAFVADPTAPTLEVPCGQYDPARDGVKWPLLMLVAPVGVLIFLFLFVRYTVEIAATFDRASRTVRISGRRLFRKPWSIERPLSDVLAIQSNGSPRFGFGLVAVFRDGTFATIVGSTGELRRKNANARVEELTQFIADRSGAG